MLSKLQRGECNYFWKKIKELNPKMEFLPLTVGGTSWESNIANLWNTHMQVVIIQLLKFKSKDPVYVNNFRPIAIATDLFKALEQTLRRDSPSTLCGLQTAI